MGVSIDVGVSKIWHFGASDINGKGQTEQSKISVPSEVWIFLPTREELTVHWKSWLIALRRLNAADDEKWSIKAYLGDGRFCGQSAFEDD